MIHLDHVHIVLTVLCYFFFFNCTICMIIFIILQGDCLYQRICRFNLVYKFIYLFIYLCIYLGGTQSKGAI